MTERQITHYDPETEKAMSDKLTVEQNMVGEWDAYYDPEPGSLRGAGKTREEAVEDLLEQTDEAWSRCFREREAIRKERDIAIAREATDYMHAVAALFAVQPEGDCLAERKPTKDHKAYSAFVYLNDQGKLLRAALATNPAPTREAPALAPHESEDRPRRESVSGPLADRIRGILDNGAMADATKLGNIREAVEGRLPLADPVLEIGSSRLADIYNRNVSLFGEGKHYVEPPEQGSVCEACDGSGEVYTETWRHPNDPDNCAVRCEACDGRGKVHSQGSAT